MNFHIGQKVVCVDANSQSPHGGKGWYDGEAPTNGTVYTIRRIWIDPTGCTVADFQELVRSEYSNACHGRVVGYGLYRFRPVIERNTDTGMAILREILDRESHQDKPPVKRTVHS